MCEFLKSPDTDRDKQEIQRLQNRVAAESVVSGYLFELLNDADSNNIGSRVEHARQIWSMIVDARQEEDYSPLIKLAL